MDEILAISEFNRVRGICVTTAAMSVVQGDAISKAYRQMIDSVYPESRMDNIKYLKKSSDAFNRFRNMDIRIIKI